MISKLLQELQQAIKKEREYYTSRLVKLEKENDELRQQIPKRGRWIKVHPIQNNDDGDYMCSECRWGGLVYNPTNYCPNCGVKMVELQESEDNNEKIN